MQREVQRHVAHKQHHLLVVAGTLLVGRQVLAQFGRQITQVGVEVVHVAVLGEQLGRRLLPHARHARQVVRGVPSQGGEQWIALRLDAAALEDARLVVERVVRDPASVVEDLDERVLHQLERVAVAGHHDDRDRFVSPPRRQRRQHVVGLEVRHAEHGDVQHLTEVADEFELVLDLRRRLGPSALVVLHHHVAKRATREVEGDGQRPGILAPHE